MQQRRVVAMGGGGFSMEPENPLLDEFVLSLARAGSPRVCFLPTASGDAEGYVARFYRAFAELPCHPTDLQLFQRTVDDLETFILSQDVVYVGGGNTASMLAVWRAHGLDHLLRRAWEEDIVLCGLSAGMNCWFEGSVTDSFCLNRLAPLPDGLGLLEGSACPHYDGEAQRRPAFHDFIASGRLSDGLAADDGAALVFSGTDLEEVVSSRPDAAAYRVARAAAGENEERRIAARYLGESGA
ncbi:MAG TPA: peptidase E [Solirubrobacteraceae bacterium]|nr:peptidase E [Solirubrobacteraceae bacterium]